MNTLVFLKHMFDTQSSNELFEGAVAIDVRAVHNYRFFSPDYVRHFVDDETTKWYTQDKTNDGDGLTNMTDKNVALGFIVAKLFPSTGGTCIDIYTNQSLNFANILDIKRQNYGNEGSGDKGGLHEREDIRFLAAVLICIVHESSFEHTLEFDKDDIHLKVNSNSKNDASKESLFSLSAVASPAADTDKGRAEENFKKMLCCLLNLNYKPTNDGIVLFNDKIIQNETENEKTDHPVLNRRVFFKAFIISYLKNTEELNAFYTALAEIRNDFGIKVKADDSLENELEEIKDNLYEVLKTEFMLPYPESSSLPYGRALSVNTKGKAYPDISQGYQNNVEAAMFQFLNCLLWVPSADVGKYVNPLEKGNGGAAPDHNKPLLTEIFNGKEIVRDLDGEISSKWHRMVANLPGAVCYKNKDKENRPKEVFVFDKIVYQREVKLPGDDDNALSYNELTAGFINMFNVIEKLINKPGTIVGELKKILQDLEGEKGVPEDKLQSLTVCMKTAVETIIGAENMGGCEVSFINSSFKLRNGRKDLFGSLIVTRKTKEGFEAEFELYSSLGHAELRVNRVEFKSGSHSAADSFFRQMKDKKGLGYLICHRIARHLSNFAKGPEYKEWLEKSRETYYDYLVGEEFYRGDHMLRIMSYLIEKQYAPLLNKREILSGVEKETMERVENIFENYLKSQGAVDGIGPDYEYWMFPFYVFRKRFNLAWLNYDKVMDRMLNYPEETIWPDDDLKSMPGIVRDFAAAYAESKKGDSQASKIQGCVDEYTERLSAKVKELYPTDIDVLIGKGLVKLPLLENYAYAKVRICFYVALDHQFRMLKEGYLQADCSDTASLDGNFKVAFAGICVMREKKYRLTSYVNSLIDEKFIDSIEDEGVKNMYTMARWFNALDHMDYGFIRRNIDNFKKSNDDVLWRVAISQNESVGFILGLLLFGPGNESGITRHLKEPAEGALKKAFAVFCGLGDCKGNIIGNPIVYLALKCIPYYCAFMIQTGQAHGFFYPAVQSQLESILASDFTQTTRHYSATQKTVFCEAIGSLVEYYNFKRPIKSSGKEDEIEYIAFRDDFISKNFFIRNALNRMRAYAEGNGSAETHTFNLNQVGDKLSKAFKKEEKK